MSLLTALIPAPYRWLAAGLLVLAVAGGLWWKADRMLTAADARGYERRAVEDKTAAAAQTARNLDLQRQAELRYGVQRGVQEKFIVTTVKEIHEAAAPLAACPVPDAVRVRLRAAARCALGDSPATCGAAGEVPGPR